MQTILDSEPVAVVFVREIDTRNILAVFPAIDEGRGLVRCFAHIGQHAMCSLAWVAMNTEHAARDDFKYMERELSGPHYNYALVTFPSVGHAMRWHANRVARLEG